MEAIIAGMVKRFEAGALSRRELIQGLAALSAAGAGPAARGQAAGGLRGIKIDHVSIQVDDLPRSIAFYKETFGFTQISEDRPNEIVRLGAGKVLVSLHHKAPTRLIDHFAIGIEKFDKDAVTKQLEARGIQPQENLDAGFHIVDPNGIRVQIMGA